MPAAITVSPSSARIDVDRAITLTGFDPGARVTLTATSRLADHTVWQSTNVYVANAHGAVSIAEQAPVIGDYEGVDSQGPLWSQVLRPPEVAAEVEPDATDLIDASEASDATVATVTPDAPAGPAHPVSVWFTATDETGHVARATLEQRYQDDGVTRLALHEDGLVGALYLPATSGPHPAIIVLNGSGGGVNEARAALLASHGYAALALGYFGAPGLPDYLSEIPLEYFQRAIQWLRATARPANGFVAVSGHSRGGELSLLLASTFPAAVNAVVAYVPSSVVHSVLNAGRPGEGRFKAAWTLAGQPLGHVWEDNAAQDWSAVDALPEPRRQAQAFVRAQKDPAAVNRSRIAVERIAGPVLLLSAGDDGYWPSSDYAREVAQRLHDAGHAHVVRHVDYPHAGHALQAPTVPTTQIARAHAVSGIVLTGGGSAPANASANRESWQEVLAFLSAAVAAHA